MRKHFVYFLGVVATIVVLMMVSFGTPSSVGPFGVLIFFLMMYVVFFSVSMAIVRVFRRISGYKKSERSDFFYAAVIGFGPIIMLLMRAFDVLNFLTFGVAVVFVLLGCFLVKNRFNVLK